MRPGIWLKNDAGTIWNLRPSASESRLTNSYFKALAGLGCKQKFTFTTVNNDFVLTDEEATQVDITGTMYFTSPKAMSNFGDFLGGYGETVRLYCDPSGQIKPENENGDVWYKKVRLAEMSSGEQDLNTACWLCKCTFTPLSSNWSKDQVQMTSVGAVSAENHVFDYIYDFVYGGTGILKAEIQNDGAKIGCSILIRNAQTNQIVDTVQWTLENGDTREYAEWNDLYLEYGQGLYVDSNPLSQECSKIIYSVSDSGEWTEQERMDVSAKQEINPQYINFIELPHGTNTITFYTSSDVIIEITFTLQTRAI